MYFVTIRERLRCSEVGDGAEGNKILKMGGQPIMGGDPSTNYEWKKAQKQMNKLMRIKNKNKHQDLI